MNKLLAENEAELSVRVVGGGAFAQTKMKMTVCCCGNNVKIVYGRLITTASLRNLLRLVEVEGVKSGRDDVSINFQGELRRVSRKGLRAAINKLVTEKS